MVVLWSSAGAAAGGSGTTLLVVLVGVAVGGWLLSLVLHPLRRCPDCNGTGKHFGSVYTRSFRLCRRCGGNGRRPRIGGLGR